MKGNTKTFALLGLIFIVIIILSGCNINEPITEDSEGIWNRYFVYPLSWLIIQIGEALGSPWGYGLSIIILTVLIRLLLLPLMLNQLRSSKKIQLIQPEIQELKKKYSSKDAVTQRKFQEAQLQLYEKYEINPLSGCLPLLIQMPILFGFYQAIVRTEQIKGQSFLWFDLDKSDPYFILPLLAGGLTFIQQKIMTKGQPQNPQLAMSLWMMPIMIIIFSIYLPAALPLYWIVGNIFTIIQTKFIKVPELEGLSAPETGSGKKRQVKPNRSGRSGGRKK